MEETLTIGRRDRTWQWFVRHARSSHALLWLALCAFADGIFLPIAPEVFLVSLMLAHPGQWRRFLPVALVSSVAGAAVGYVVASFLFTQFGLPLLRLYHLQPAFMRMQAIIRGHVFLTMFLGNFSPLPDKVLIYAGGFLGVRFLPFISGYFLGRGLRMSLVCYLTERHGKRIFTYIDEYLKVIALLIILLLIYYGIVHFHVFGL